ncbi:MAG: hypothetical protein KatS3mg042_1246 [Rhodothermaceae bacterium]|nr:MAG: hypothetical protein KatS3mg042_1246 [Rhodothermaceae bacterium]
MMKEVLRSLETGHLAEVGLIAFLVAFLLLVARAFLMRPGERSQAKHLPLDDPEPLSLPSNHA